MQEIIASTPLLAFLVLATVYAIGELTGTFSKAWIPSTFVMAALFIIGYWTFFPAELVSASGMAKPLTNVIFVYLITVHMGTTISLKEFIKQWKVVIICLVGLLGMILFGWFIAGLFVERQLIIAGIPPLTGGLIASLNMQKAALDKGLEIAAILTVAMYSVQGFAGYPLTAVCLKHEGKRLLKNLREGKSEGTQKSISGDMENPMTGLEKRKLIPETPAKYFTPGVALFKLTLVSLLAMYISSWSGGVIAGTISSLVLGVVFCEIGFLEKDILRKSGCFNFMAVGLMLFIFDGLKGATPEILGAAIGPLVILIIIGVIGMGVFSFVIAKALKVSPFMAIAVSLTSLYGFPPNYIITEEACRAIAGNEEEKQYLMDRMLPQMLVGGFVTVTITSVIIAGIFAGWL